MPQQDFAFSGVYAAALTPQTAAGDVDIQLMASHCRWLLDNGCDGLAILGTTGEANSFGLKERIGILNGLAEAGIPGDTLMPGTGACALPDAIALTRVAMDNGAGGVLMLPPFYYKNPSDDGLFAAYSEVIQAIGKDALNICLYHFPQMSGVPIPYSLIERLLKEYPGTVVGMKDSSGDLDNMVGAAKKFPGFAVFSGSDELMLPLLKAGGAGCITACANVASPLANQVYQGWRNGDDIQAIHETLTAVRAAIVKFPLSAGLKMLMARHSGHDDWRNVRAPLMRLNDADRDTLFETFDAIGYQIPSVA